MLADLVQAVQEMQKTHHKYKKAEEYYDGEVPEYFGSRRMRRALREAADRYRLNLAKTPVNAVANRLEVTAATVPDQDALTGILQTEVWDPNELTFEVPGLIVNACKFGDAYLLVWEGPDGEGVEISYNSPYEGRMLYDPENARRKKAYAHVWCENGVRYADLFYADTLEQYYQDEKGQKPEDVNAWQKRVTAFREPDPGEELDPRLTTEEQLGVWPIPNEWGQVPAFHFRTARPWGTPLHKDAYGPQDAITKIISAHMGTVDYQTFPQRYALEEAGNDTDALEDDDFTDWDEHNNASSAASGRPEHGLRAGSGEVWWLRGVKGVGQFDVADPKVFMDPSEFYVRMMAQTTDTPLHFFDPGGDQPSGESRRTAEGTLVKKTKTLSQGFGFTLGDTLGFAMLVLGHGDIHVDIRWAPFDSTEDTDSWTVAEAKIRAGVPVAQVLQEQGYTKEQVDGWLQSTDEQDLVRKVSLLDSIGDAVQKLGAGVGFGVITTEQVSQVIQTVLEPESE